MLVLLILVLMGIYKHFNFSQYFQICKKPCFICDLKIFTGQSYAFSLSDATGQK